MPTKKPAHTPGPWTDISQVMIGVPGIFGLEVVYASAPDRIVPAEEHEANLALAKAAPALLTELRIARHLVDGLVGAPGTINAAVAKIDATILRALGTPNHRLEFLLQRRSDIAADQEQPWPTDIDREIEAIKHEFDGTLDEAEGHREPEPGHGFYVSGGEAHALRDDPQEILDDAEGR